MAAANPYDLSAKKRGGPNRPVQAVPLTEAEQLEKLAGYVVVPKELWPFVKYSTHVRYTEKSGEFRPGGFVLNNPFDTKVRDSAVEKRFIKMQNSFYKNNRDHKEWIVAYEDIEFLYAKGTAVELTLQRDLQSAVTALNANIARLADYAKKLDRRVSELETP